MSQVDLHLHTTVSDGKYSPAEIVRKAAANGVTILAIADHDSVDGVAAARQAAKTFPGMRVIAAVEISTDVPLGEAHVLGYFVDCADQDLLAALQRLRDSRVDRAQRMVQKLAGLGMRVEWERVKELAGGSSIGRPHIAEALLEKGYINSFKEAFNKYLGRGGPAYVEREKLTPVEAVQLILRARGLPVLAHPFTVGDTEGIVAELAAAGLVGLESYYDSYKPEEVSGLLKLAAQHKLLPTGGSDYHGLDDINETAIGGVEVPMAAAEQLIALARERGLAGAQ